MRRVLMATGLLALLMLAVGQAEPPLTFAIQGARIVTAAGPAIARGTIVLRGGVIEAVGGNVAVPAGARVIDASGLTVYPGLIDMHNTGAVDIPQATEPRNPKTMAELERWKRSVLLRPQVAAAEHVKVDSNDFTRLASAGITAVLAVPPGPVVKGRSALVHVVAPEEAPQIGAVADVRQGAVVVRAPVALHVEFPRNPRHGNAYPVSLMGVIAFVRQSFLDARHLQATIAGGEGAKPAQGQTGRDPALEGLTPAVTRRMPVAFEATEAREIRRALRMAEELGLDPIITGGLHAAETVEDLKARGARVIYSLNYPTRPATLAPEADEPLRDLRARAAAPRTPAALQKAGVPFAFGSSGLKDPRDFVKHAARAVAEGLPEESAVRALTIGAAHLAGVSDRIGSIEAGKVADLVVTEGNLFDENMKVRHVFIEGRPVPVQDLPTPRREPRRTAR